MPTENPTSKQKMLNINLSIYDLTMQYPELIDLFAGMGFSSVKNPMLLRTAGRTISLKTAMTNFKLTDDPNFAKKMHDAGFVLVEQ